MKWLIPLLVILFYVHLFNAISPIYFASDRELTLLDLWEIVKRNLGLSSGYPI
jgi:hypothetical protein